MGRKRKGDKTAPKGEIFAFRVTTAEKHELSLAVEKAHYEANRRRKEGEPQVDKSEIIRRALKLGLGKLALIVAITSGLQGCFKSRVRPAEARPISSHYIGWSCSSNENIISTPMEPACAELGGC